MQISNSCLVQLPKKQSRKPRDRFVKYYQDLYALYDKSISPDTFLMGSQYSYSELGDSVLSTYFHNNNLNQVELICIVTWAHEFDPDYASISAYFSHHYQFQGKIFDVSDQGTLGFFTAVDLIKKYMNTSSLQCALVLMFEQTTIPREKNQAIVPVYDAAFGVFISRYSHDINNKTPYEVVAAGIQHNKQIDHLISHQCAKFSIPQDKLKLLIKDKECVSLSNVSTKFVSAHPGMFPFLFYLHDLLEGREMADYLLMIEKDAESTDMGYLIMRKNQ